MKLMKDINKIDISTVEMIVSHKHGIKYVQEFIKMLKGIYVRAHILDEYLRA